VQIRQVIVNLAVNAVQAMPSGGRLQVTTRPHGSQVWLTVKDTGTGMTEHVKQKLFMPFFTTKDSHEGTGLGLSVTHGILIAHGGSIRFESTLGSGSEFIVQLPVHTAVWEAEEPTDEPS
jgi:signal transduction histidine kinase